MRKKLHKVHDAFVKNLLSHKESAVSFIQEAISVELFRELDVEHLTFVPSSYVTGELAEYISDLVFKIPVTGTSGTVTVSVLIEHKSRADHMTCVQLLKYITSGYEQQHRKREKFSLIIPVIYYHGKGTWKYRPLHELFQDIPEGFERYIPSFSIELFQVQHLTITQIHSIAEARLRAAFMVQKSLHDQLVAQKDFVNVINALEPTDEGNFLHSFFVYLSNVTNFDENSIIEITNQLTTDMKSKTMTFIDQFRAEGRQEGSLEKAYAFARKLMRRNMPFEEICELTDLSLDEVKRLAAEISNQ